MKWQVLEGLLLLSLYSCSLLPDGSAFLERGSQTVQHHTVKELRDLHVVKQQQDYSCGAAALATLMVYYFGEDTSEKEILQLLISRLTEEEKQGKALRGFSLLDLKEVAQSKGYRAAGFKITMTQLARVTAPVIVFIEPQGYKHFAVYRGLDRGRVYLADPSRGNLRMSLGRFLSEWSGIVFVLGKPGEEEIKDYPLMIPHPPYVQPELARFNGAIDLGTMIRPLPQR
jgi:predicted double-glycine peptidase